MNNDRMILVDSPSLRVVYDRNTEKYEVAIKNDDYVDVYFENIREGLKALGVVN